MQNNIPDKRTARRETNKLYFHFNMLFATVSLAEALFCMKLLARKRQDFSMRDVKMVCIIGIRLTGFFRT
jgi:hypothetical protein